ncbi:MAG: hypothetical protein ACJ8BC_08320 [Gemmatimonadales bacterium]
MKLRRAAETAIQLLLLTTMKLSAQTPARPVMLDSGTVVRLQLHSGVREKGKLLSPYTQDSSRVRYCHYPAPPCRVGDERYRDQPADDVSGLEVRRGTAWLPGLLIGGAVGVVFGLAAAGFAESLSEVPNTSGQEITAVVGSTAFFGGLGALIGSAFEKWDAATPDHSHQP